MLERHLEKHFNFSSFRPGQREIVETIMSGRDVLALLPTGGGKSLCYQLPAIMSEKLSVVVSPLIALMKDQVDALNARGISAAFLNSSLEFSEVQKINEEIKNGRVKILYVAPERFLNAGFQQFFSDLEVHLLAVDEAHCVSQWGHDFRPEYLNIKNHIATLKRRPIVAAFTATATPEVKEDILERLALQEPGVFVRGFDRPNLKFLVQNNLKAGEKPAEILRIIQSLSGAGIVYALTRKETEFLAEYLKDNGVAAAAYHAGMSSEKRTAIQNDFMENRFQVIVATVAFGMGVDKADIRFVIHAGMPGSLEGYYQEAGRAGRDGEKSFCVLLHGKKDVSTHKYFIRLDREEMASQGKDWDEINRVIGVKYDRLEKMIEYALASKCRRKMILEYFDDPQVGDLKANCGGCDVCLGWKGKPRAAKRRSFQDRGISGTVLESVKLYQKNYSPEKIAKIRSLGLSTIFEHLTRWYLSGGAFRIEEYIGLGEMRLILAARDRAEVKNSLRAIKDLLPENFTYEKIRLALAREEKEK